MKTPKNLTVISISIAEKVLRDIARREGEAIKKRRSRVMIEHYGSGYMVFDPVTNFALSGVCGLAGQDGCGDSLKDLAERYEGCERNTHWQKIVLAAVKQGRIAEL